MIPHKQLSLTVIFRIAKIDLKMTSPYFSPLFGFKIANEHCEFHNHLYKACKFDEVSCVVAILSIL